MWQLAPKYRAKIVKYFIYHSAISMKRLQQSTLTKLNLIEKILPATLYSMHHNDHGHAVEETHISQTL